MHVERVQCLTAGSPARLLEKVLPMEAAKLEPDGTPTTADTQRPGYSSSVVWVRGLYMLLLLLAFGIAQTLLCATAIAQFLWLLFAGETNSQLAQFGGSLARWVGDAARYVTCATDVKPFPWAPWPPAQ